MYEQKSNPLVLPAPSASFFGFKGNPVEITITKVDGTKLVDPHTAAQPEKKEPQNGNDIQ